MSTTEIRPVNPTDFDRVMPLLEEFQANRMTRDDWWNMLFRRRWDHAAEPCGYAVVDHDQWVGFLGCIFSVQRIDTRDVRFCNLSSFIVKPTHRLSAFSLLQHALQASSCTFTNLTPIDASARLFRRYGFDALESKTWVVTPLSGWWRRTWPAAEFTTELSEIAPELGPEDRQILEDHRDAHCAHLLLRTKRAHCYLISTARRLKGQHVRHLHHISDPAFFWRYVGEVQRAFWLTYRARFLMVDARHLDSTGVPGMIARPLAIPMLYRNPPGESLHPAQIRSLYSELMWLRA